MKKFAQFRDEVANILADICSETRYEPALAQLFNSSGGKWILAQDLCSGLSELCETITEVQQKAASLDRSAENPRLFLCWIPYPESEDYCTITLFLNDYLWSWIALYNYRRFIEK
jgi:hypothetical protein